eukprot:GHVN01094856.1.p1 GENE.GHVN01094856.1~~GHVN01094856.1.p1  ORF type:complete len:464 (-),score=95.14 GHVN01094856.1:281-1492(-)
MTTAPEEVPVSLPIPEEVEVTPPPTTGKNNKRVYNFSPGPASLPIEVLEEAQAQCLNYNGTGMSVMEMTHGSGNFQKIFKETLITLREVLSLPDDFQMLFTAGGATQQFSSVPLNLLEKEWAPADYVVTGAWGEKAIVEAQKFGMPVAVVDTKGGGYNTIPPTGGENWAKLNKDAKYLHYTSNETICGIQHPTVPKGLDGVPIVCDMSSDFCTRPIDWSKHSVVYAGAQKNIGIAGVTVLCLKKDLIGKEISQTPTSHVWRWASEYDSMYNTPPTWNIYMTGLMAKYIKQQGGLTAMEDKTSAKAKLIYDAVDGSDGFYLPHSKHKHCRSKCNVVFTITNGRGQHSPTNEELFVRQCEEAGLTDLKGHRSVGGVRASLYNGLSIDGVEKLAGIMKSFQEENSK